MIKNNKKGTMQKKIILVYKKEDVDNKNSLTDKQWNYFIEEFNDSLSNFFDCQQTLFKNLHEFKNNNLKNYQQIEKELCKN